MQAEEYLSQAQWTVLKTPECSNSIKSRLYRNIGLLYATQGNSQDALRQFADDVSFLYFTSLVNLLPSKPPSYQISLASEQI